MINITTIPLSELKNDLAETVIDIKVCDLALLHGIVTYSGGQSTSERLRINKEIKAKIEAEIDKRGLSSNPIPQKSRP